MSIIICKHCGAKVDTDFNSEHEDECDYNDGGTTWTTKKLRRYRK